MEKFVTTKAEYQWNGKEYVLESREGYWYGGDWALAASSPEPPPAPDPREIARTDAEFNRIDQTTPFGSLTFSGPNRNQSNLQFSPEVQALFDQRLQSDSNLLGQAIERQGLLNPNPIDLSQFGQIQSGIDQSNINFQGPQFGDFPVLDSPNLERFNGSLNLQNAQGVNAPNAPTLQSGISQQPIQRQVNNPFDIQGSVDLGLNTSGLPGIPQDINQFRGDVEQSVFDRGRALLDPLFGDQERRLEQRLANQGLPTSGEAVDRDKVRFSDARNRAFTDLANAATITGGQEASRALGDILGARGQGFGEQVTGADLNLAGGQFGNQAAQQGLNQELAQGGFANNAAQQGFNQALASGQFGNQAALGQFGAGLSGAQFGLGQNLSLADQGNQNQLNQFQAGLQGTGFNNQAGLLGLGANQGIRGQLFGEGIQSAGANNQASQLNLALQQQLLNNNNAARAQGLGEAQGIRGNQFNELMALIGGQQVQAPQQSNFFAPGQADVSGAFALNQQAQQFGFNAEQNQANALNGGLFGLGGALLGGPIGGAIGSSLFGGGGNNQISPSALAAINAGVS